MENTNISLEEMENKSNEVMAEIAEKAQEDLADAQFIDYGNSKEEVAIVNNVKAQLEQTFNGMKENAVKTMEKIDSDIAKFERLKKFLQNGADAHAVSDVYLSEILKEQIAPIDKSIADLNSYKTKFNDKLTIVDKVLNDYLALDIAEDGKAYYSQIAIDFCKLMLA